MFRTVAIWTQNRPPREQKPPEIWDRGKATQKDGGGAYRIPLKDDAPVTARRAARRPPGKEEREGQPRRRSACRRRRRREWFLRALSFRPAAPTTRRLPRRGPKKAAAHARIVHSGRTRVTAFLHPQRLLARSSAASVSGFRFDLSPAAGKQGAVCATGPRKEPRECDAHRRERARGGGASAETDGQQSGSRRPDAAASQSANKPGCY